MTVKGVEFNVFMLSSHLCGTSFPARQKPVYKNTSLSKRFLLSDTAFSLRGYIQHCDKTVWPLFSHLEDAVREGTNQHERAFGKKSKDLFQVILWHPGIEIKKKKQCKKIHPNTFY